MNDYILHNESCKTIRCIQCPFYIANTTSSSSCSIHNKFKHLILKETSRYYQNSIKIYANKLKVLKKWKLL